RRKGASVCANATVLPLEETERQIVQAMTGVVLQPAFIARVLDTVFVPDAVNRLGLEAERDELERQIGHLTEAVKLGGNIPVLVEELKQSSLRLRDIRCLLEPREHEDRERLRAAMEQRVDEWREILRTSPAQGRQVLKQVLGTIAILEAERVPDRGFVLGAD